LRLRLDDATVVGTSFARTPSSRIVVLARARRGLEVTMAPETLETRVERLERTVDTLEALPARVAAVESQIVQLRHEMKEEFSAIRTDLTGRMEELHAAALEHAERLNTATNARMVELNDETRRLMVELNDETRRQMVELNDETRRHMLVLHEEIIARIKRLGEGSGRSRRAKKKPH
jgi:uncharacterized protein YPO0396